jgi:hypothetical protein
MLTLMPTCRVLVQGKFDRPAQATREKLLTRPTSDDVAAPHEQAELTCLDDVRIKRRRGVMFITVSAGQRVNGGAG